MMPFDPENLANLQRRIACMERQCSLFKRACIAVICLMLTCFVLGSQLAPASRTLETNKLVLRDDKGRERAVLSIEDDAVQLSFYDANGQQHVVLSGDDHGGGLALFDERGKNRAQLGVQAKFIGLTLRNQEGANVAQLASNQEETGLLLKDNQSEHRVRLEVASDRSLVRLVSAEDGKGNMREGIILSAAEALPGIGLRKNNQWCSAWLVENDLPTMRFHDRNNQRRMAFGVGPGGSFINQFRRTGDLMVFLGECLDEGQGALQFLDTKQRPKAELGVTEDGPLLRLFDKNENPCFSKP